MQKEADLAAHSAEEPNRRDFIVIAAQAFAGVGAAAALWPFIDQMNPDASMQALASIEVDYAKVDKLRGMNVTFVTTARTDEESKLLLRYLGMPFRNQ